MFGLFQSDMPIGKRLWLLLLALVVAGTIASTPLAKVSADPITFTTDLLLLYGLGFLIESLATNIIGWLIAYISTQRRRKNSKPQRPSFFVKLEVPRHISYYVSLAISPFIFVIAVSKITPHFGTLSRKFGAFGLLLFLIAELLTSIKPATHKDHHEFLSLRMISRGEIKGHLADSRDEEFFDFKANWMKTLAFLAENKWEIVEYSQGNVTQNDDNEPGSFALLKRHRVLHPVQVFLLKLERRYLPKLHQKLSTIQAEKNLIENK